MCGLAGIFSYNHRARDVDIVELRRIRDHMATRGPDGKGEWISENKRVALAYIFQLFLIKLLNIAGGMRAAV